MKYLGAPSSGSIAGTTHARNRFGQYTRTRATPVNPNSPRQAAVRTLFGQASGNWGALDPAVKAAWETYAQNHPKLDPLGQTIFWTGHQWYVSLSVRLLNAGIGSVLVGPPTDQTFPALAIEDPVFELNAALTAINTMEIGGAPTLPANHFIIWEFSPPLPGGTSFNAEYRYIGTMEPTQTFPLAVFGTATPPTLASLYLARFGLPSLGQRTWFRWTPVVSGAVAPGGGEAEGVWMPEP